MECCNFSIRFQFRLLCLMPCGMVGICYQNRIPVGHHFVIKISNTGLFWCSQSLLVKYVNTCNNKYQLNVRSYLCLSTHPNMGGWAELYEKPGWERGWREWNGTLRCKETSSMRDLFIGVYIYYHSVQIKCKVYILCCQVMNSPLQKL